MKKTKLIQVWAILLLSFLGINHLSAQFLEDTETVDVVLIPGFDGDGSMEQYYLADLGAEYDSIAWNVEADDKAKWYRIPAGGVSDGENDVQAFYYKNVATGRYLYISDETKESLADQRDGDWPIARAEAADTNEETLAYKWFDRETPWPWGVYITNADGIDMSQEDGNRYNVLNGIILMKVSEGGEEFFGVYAPNGSVGGFKGGTGNAWTAVKQVVVLETVSNPDVQHFLKNTKTVNVIQITTWMTPNNEKLDENQPYVADVDGEILFLTDASDENTKWYEIPAGGNAFDEQLYYYKNVVTGTYLQGSTRAPGDGGDWTVSAATASTNNDGSDLFKWSKIESNWGNGPWLVNELGNTGERPSGDNKDAFFALTMLTANSEFFGVDVPNVAVSNPHDGGNAWTAVELNIVDYNVANPDYKEDNAKAVNIIQISTWMTPNNAALGDVKPYAADVDGKVVYSTEAENDNTKWYEIPAGPGVFGQQVYYYKNVETGTYLVGSTREVGEGGDWTVSEAITSADNDGSATYKWSQLESNWGNGPWLVNELGNTGERPSGDNKNAFFALTMLTANSEFFGVDVPNLAISNPHDGGNAWTAIEYIVLSSGETNPDYVSDGGIEYSVDALNFFATDGGEDLEAASYNPETKTITYKNGGWHRAGWNWEDEGGIDVSAYNQVWIKFDASALPKTGDGEDGATKIQFDVVYMDDSTAADFDNKSNEVRSNDTEYFYNLTPDKKVKRITLKSEAEGDIVLTDAYFYFKGDDPVDLIVTDISWDPVEPLVTDSILFSATIKNISEFASTDVKHGVTFSVKPLNTEGTGTLVAWSDTHLTSLAPGEEVTLTANGGPKGEAKWKFGKANTYVVVAHVNDQKDVLEVDYDNNILEKEIVVGEEESGLLDVFINGKIVVESRKLYMTGFPVNSVVTLYNMQGQNIGHYFTKDVNGITLSENLYILNIRDDKVSKSIKILVK